MEGKKYGIDTAFIDLSYGDILAASQAGKGLLKEEEEKSNYNDDYLLSRIRPAYSRIRSAMNRSLARQPSSSRDSSDVFSLARAQ